MTNFIYSPVSNRAACYSKPFKNRFDHDFSQGNFLVHPVYYPITKTFFLGLRPAPGSLLRPLIAHQHRSDRESADQRRHTARQRDHRTECTIHSNRFSLNSVRLVRSSGCRCITGRTGDRKETAANRPKRQN